jgi:hypothetical protein
MQKRLTSQPPAVGILMVFSGSPDAGLVPCRLMFVSENEAISLRADALPEEGRPEIVGVVVNQLSGEALAIWRLPFRGPMPEIPVVSIPSNPTR